MNFYDPYSAYRNSPGNPGPVNQPQTNIGSLGYGGINTAPYYNPYINQQPYPYNYGIGYYNNNYYAEMQQRQKAFEDNQRAMLQACIKMAGAFLNKSEEEIQQNVLSVEPDYIKEKARKEREQMVKILQEIEEEEICDIKIIRDGKVLVDTSEKKVKEKKNKKEQIVNSGFFSMNQMNYIDDVESNYRQERLQRTRVEHIILHGREISYAINPRLAQEIEKSKQYDKMSVVEYFNKEFGAIYCNLILEEELAKGKANALKNRYNTNDFRNILYNSTSNNPMYTSLGQTYFRQPVNKNDLEVHLPTQINNSYAARRKAFIDKIMANAARVGTDITLGGNIDVNEVYKNDR